MSGRSFAGIIAGLLLILYIGVGGAYRTWATSAWGEDYRIAFTHAITELPGAEDAAAFFSAYDDMRNAVLVTGPVHYYRANEAHKRWAAHFRAESPSGTPDEGEVR